MATLDEILNGCQFHADTKRAVALFYEMFPERNAGLTATAFVGEFAEVFMGVYGDEREFAYELALDNNYLSSEVAKYFDLDRFANDLFESNYAGFPLHGGDIAVFSIDIYNTPRI